MLGRSRAKATIKRTAKHAPGDENHVARPDDADAADDLVVDRARGPASRRRRGRIASRRGRHSPHHVQGDPSTLPPTGQCARGQRHPRWATGSPPSPGTATATWSCTSRSPAAGSVLHTINPRLHPEQIAWIVNHAEDSALFFDLTFLPIVEAIAAHCKTVRHWVLMTDRAHMPASTKVPNLLCYEDLVGSYSDKFTWPEFDENTASSLCYTSGTTGNPKRRAVQPPLDRAAHAGGGPAGRAERLGA